MGSQTLGGDICIGPRCSPGLGQAAKHSILQCNTMFSNAIQCYPMQYNVIQFSAMFSNAIQCSPMQYYVLQWNAMLSNAMQCYVIQCFATQCYATQCYAMQFDAMQYNDHNTMQYYAIHWIQHYPIPEVARTRSRRTVYCTVFGVGKLWSDLLVKWFAVKLLWSIDWLVCIALKLVSAVQWNSW